MVGPWRSPCDEGVVVEVGPAEKAGAGFGFGLDRLDHAAWIMRMVWKPGARPRNKDTSAREALSLGPS